MVRDGILTCKVKENSLSCNERTIIFKKTTDSEAPVIHQTKSWYLITDNGMVHPTKLDHHNRTIFTTLEVPTTQNCTVWFAHSVQWPNSPKTSDEYFLYNQKTKWLIVFVLHVLKLNELDITKIKTLGFFYCYPMI